MKFSFKCDDTTHLCDKHQYNEVSFFDRLMMKIHFMLCKKCRHYSKRNHRLTRTLDTVKIRMLPDDEKNNLKNKLKEEMNKPPKP